MYFISIFSPCRVDSVITSVLSWCYWIYTVTSLHPFHQKFCLWMNNYKYHRFISQATDDVVKVEVWDVVDKGKWISRICLSVCLSLHLFACLWWPFSEHYENEQVHFCLFSSLSSLTILSFLYHPCARLRPKISSSWMCRWARLKCVATYVIPYVSHRLAPVEESVYKSFCVERILI